MAGKIILTGDRPTGRLHVGHYVGSILRRLELQQADDIDKMYVMIADAQALTDNADNPAKVRENVLEVALDYLACGIDPAKVTLFIQTMVPELCELTMYYMNLVSVARLERNPTVKSEIKLRAFSNSIPVGFLNYPVSQAADITAFKADTIPVGEDQLPMIEQCQEIVQRFNYIYGETLVMPQAVLPQLQVCRRLPGIDGKSKMSKSVGNCIYLADTQAELQQKVMSMFTDPNHLRVSDPGRTEGNPVFIYLEAFAEDEHFSAFNSGYQNLREMKEHYERGGLGDVKVKRFLLEVMESVLAPIRARREELSRNIDYVYDVLYKGSQAAEAAAAETLTEVRNAMKINYFTDGELKAAQAEKYAR